MFLGDLEPPGISILEKILVAPAQGIIALVFNCVFLSSLVVTEESGNV
jgi:hypothetical protein